MEPFKTLGELAKIYGVSYGELWWAVKNKRLPSAKINGVLVAHVDHVKNLMEVKNKTLVTKWT